MNILIDINHPAHVHLLKHAYQQLKSDGHNVWVTTRTIPLAQHLLDVYKIPYTIIGAKKDSLLKKAFVQLSIDKEMFHFVRTHQINLGIGPSITLAHVSRITKMKSIILDDDDDDVEPMFVKYAHPFADVILSPDCIRRKATQTVYYTGYHDLAYLHPNVFSPNPDILSFANLKKGEPFFILRFNAFKAHHDVGEAGLTLDEKRALIQLLSNYGRVLITSERELEPEFRQYQISIPPEHIHSLMYYSTMFVGDSQSMTSEAAVLGTPALKCNTFAGRLSVPNELEQKYGLCYAFLPSQFTQMLSQIREILSMPDAKQIWRQKVETMLSDKIDVSAFFTSFIENYPNSAKV